MICVYASGCTDFSNNGLGHVNPQSCIVTETLNGEWSVTTIGEMAVPDSVDAFMGFNLEEKTIYGSTGCNQLTGSLPTEITPEVPLFAAMGSTRMMCADMTIEDAMLPALGSVVDFKLDGNTLLLLNADGQTVMTLEKR